MGLYDKNVPYPRTITLWLNTIGAAIARSANNTEAGIELNG